VTKTGQKKANPILISQKTNGKEKKRKKRKRKRPPTQEKGNPLEKSFQR